jgi:ABC-2 type transport system permease protein
MAAILTLAVKDLRLLLRDRVGFFFTFFFPLLYSIFFGVLFAGTSKGPSAIPVAVVNEDRTPASEEFIASLRRTSSLSVDIVDSRDAAADLVRRGARNAYVVIPAGFGEASQRLFWGEPMRLEIGTDPGQAMTAGMIEGLVTARAYERMQRLFTDPQAMRDNARRSLEVVRSSDSLSGLQRTLLETLLTSVEALPDLFSAENAAASTQASAASQPDMGGWRPVEITSSQVTRPAAVGRPRYPPSSFAFCFPQGIIWGVMACAATFAASLLVERTRGTLPRLTAAPLARWQILAGKAAACFFTTAGLIAALLLVARVGFGVRPTSLPLLVVAIFCVTVAIVGLMMVLSVLGKTEQAVSGISWALIVVLAMLGGGMVPLAFMPAWMQQLSGVSLVKWAILALEGALWRGFSPAEMTLPCGILLGVGVGGFALGAGVFRWSDQR